ncbi:MAG: DMT family transporter [Bacteroidota bacterium]
MNRTGPYWALTVICIVWGTTYGAIRLGMTTGFPPVLFSAFRYLFAGAALLAYFAFSQKLCVPDLRDVKRMLVSGFFFFIAGNLLMVYGQQTVGGGLASLLNAAYPFWVVLITRMWNPSEQTPPQVWLGIVIGLLGQWLIIGGHWNDSHVIATPGGLLLILAGLLSGSFASVYMRKYPVSMEPVQAAGWQMLLCGIPVALFGWFGGEGDLLPANPKSWMALAYLVLVGSVIGYSLFVYAIRHLPAQQVSIYAYVNPVIALLVGALWMHEPVTGRMLLAMAVIFTGVYLVNRGMTIRSSRET